MSKKMNNAKLYICRDYEFDPLTFLPSLPKERAEKVCRVKLQKDKKNCAGAYILLKYALKQEGIENFETRMGQNGKPYLKDIPLFFNLSHTDCGFICAVSQSEIGADIQSRKEPSDNLLKRVCSEKELQKVTNAENKAIEFTRLWTLKEAAIKKNAGVLADYAKYEFSEEKTDFYKYGAHFMSFETSDCVIGLCGKFEKIETFNLNFCEII